ncbi:hypothetical protein GCM10007391_09300 [Alteromonas halophila]|uniref:Uncharacterized protein n=2 Tax=Alteromonas halophila TaxID=516698 RepID=A0A918MWG6_9ALTE|nr:hypothetical protein GCM10007391_09300 [Alteromonas halophila]
MVVTVPQTTSECHWQAQMDVQTSTSIQIRDEQPQCNGDVTGVSWYSWLAGKSVSYQFHFLDLLELLYSNDDKRGHFGASANQ